MSSESVYVVVNYTSCKEDYFPDNKPDHFFIKLSKPLLLTEGRWKVGLCEIDFENVRIKKGYPRATHYIVDLAYCDGLLIHGRPTNSLRRIIYMPSGNEIFTSPFYVNVQTTYIDTCEICIKTLGGPLKTPVEIKQFPDTCITVTLHFKKIRA